MTTFLPPSAATHAVSNGKRIREMDDADDLLHFAQTTRAQLGAFDTWEDNATTRALSNDLRACEQQYRQLTGEELPHTLSSTIKTA